MRENKHTPGIWFVELEPKNDYWRSGKTIGSMPGATYCGEPIAVRVADVCMFTPDETAFANARLIAAAPDMIDALRQWAFAELTNDAEELANARIARDLAISKSDGRS